ncbi:hypothetical protein K490DRAFT_48221 [Saccharata proteae CBS 121410]|uniref:Ribosomal protein L9 domain-containing protein n=1 Tax=Saccharata proteae CBS 121410 TaxID=1314787 RepID=A0A9P4HT32_9PEZI|nr:hypothetical protein K490DRAFT_48221 [Saccharata proteae CBS 121410]
MATGIRSSLLPQCRSCARRFTEIGFNGWRPLLQQQSRSVSQAQQYSDRKKDQTPVPARLLVNVPGYGPKGEMARYLSKQEIKTHEVSGKPLERNVKYGIPAAQLQRMLQQERAAAAEKEKMAKEKEQRKTPKRSLELLDIFCPATFVDYRDPIETSKEEAEMLTRDRRLSNPNSAAAILAAAAASAQAAAAAQNPVRTFGRFTTRDIARMVTREMSRNDEASKVVVKPEDVKFLNVGESGDENGVDFLGEYIVEIRVKGAEEGIRRKARLASTAELR